MTKNEIKEIKEKIKEMENPLIIISNNGNAEKRLNEVIQEMWANTNETKKDLNNVKECVHKLHKRTDFLIPFQNAYEGWLKIKDNLGAFSVKLLKFFIKLLVIAFVIYFIFSGEYNEIIDFLSKILKRI